VKKVDASITSGGKLNSFPLSLADLVQLVDVSVVSKFGADLTQFTCVVAEDMHNTLETFKTDLSNNLPRQVRSVVQQIHGDA
jgi:hypothetical protein